MVDQVHLEDRTSDRKYFTMLPNMVWELGLSCFDVALYAYIKRVAGETGQCWYSMRDLAQQAGMSLGAVQDSRKELEAKQLITCKKRKHAKTGWPTWHISITDIWQRNMEVMARKVYAPRTDESVRGAYSYDESVCGAYSLGQKCMQDARKEEPLEEEPLEEEPSAANSAAPVVADTLLHVPDSVRELVARGKKLKPTAPIVDMNHAFQRGVGQSETKTLPKGRPLEALRDLVESGYTPGDVEDYARSLKAGWWRDKVLTLVKVAEGLGQWVSAGRPGFVSSSSQAKTSRIKVVDDDGSIREVEVTL